MEPISENQVHKLFLGGLSWETTEESLGAHFEQFGSVADVVVMRNKATNQPRGFGFVTFRDKDAAERAIRTPHLIDGRSVDAKPSIPQQHTQHHMAHNISDVSMNGPRGRTRKLFVGGLPSELTVEELRSYFEAFGTITDSVIMIDQNTGRSRGFGFVSFDSPDSIDRVFASGSHHVIKGRDVEVKCAIPRSDSGRSHGSAHDGSSQGGSNMSYNGQPTSYYQGQGGPYYPGDSSSGGHPGDNLNYNRHPSHGVTAGRGRFTTGGFDPALQPIPYLQAYQPMPLATYSSAPHPSHYPPQIYQPHAHYGYPYPHMSPVAAPLAQYYPAYGQQQQQQGPPFHHFYPSNQGYPVQGAYSYGHHMAPPGAYSVPGQENAAASGSGEVREESSSPSARSSNNENTPPSLPKPQQQQQQQQPVDNA